MENTTENTFKPYFPQVGEKFMIQLKGDNSWRECTWICRSVNPRFVTADILEGFALTRKENHKLFFDNCTFFPVEGSKPEPKDKKDPTKGMTKIRSVMAETEDGELIKLATFEDPITGLRLTIKKGLEVEAEPIKEPTTEDIVDALCRDVSRLKGTANHGVREAGLANSRIGILKLRMQGHDEAIIRLDKATKRTLWSTLRDTFVLAGALALIAHLAIRLFS